MISTEKWEQMYAADKDLKVSKRVQREEAEKYKALLKEQHRLLVESYTLLRTFEPLIAPLSNAYLINEIKTYREKVEELLR